MAYVPNNISVFTAAYAGALSGMGIGAGILTDTTAADYAGICSIGLAFAEAFDTQWGGRPIDTFVIDQIQSDCEESFSGRPCRPIGPPLTLPTNWIGESNAIIALVLEGSATVAGQGITPLPFPPAGGFGVGVLIFPTIAAMAAYNVGTPIVLTEGQQAFVQSNGSWWTLIGSAEPTDGITIVNGTGQPNAQWLRENVSGYAPAYLLQTTWSIDPLNGNDESSGLNSANALKTKAELYRRWGYTWKPNLNGIAVTVTQQNPDTAPGDSGFFEPNLLNGASFRYTSTTFSSAPAFVGTLLAVTAKNAATNTPLQSTFTTVSGGPILKDMILVNVTRGNSAAAVNAFGAGSATIDQPLAPQTLGQFPTTTNVDTWANGDVIHGFLPMAVDLARVGGVVASVNVNDGPQFQVDGITFSDLSENGGDITFDLGCYPLINNCIVRKVSAISGSAAIQGFFVGVGFALGVTGNGGAIFSYQFSGGHFESNVTCVAGAAFTNNPTAQNSVSLVNGRISDTFYGTASASLATRGLCVVAGPVFGAWPINAQQGFISYTAPAATAFPTSGALSINGQANAYSLSTTAGVTTWHQTTLTAAHLDATPSGAAAFGGLACIPGVGGWTTGATP
jgi:hypothetical protein